MTFYEYINNVKSRFNSEHTQEPFVVTASFFCSLVPAVEDFIKENASMFQIKSGLSFVPEKEPEGKVCYLNNLEVRADYRITFSSFDLLDYSYAVLHSRSYNKKFKEFINKDFSWIPYPKDTEAFWKLVELGGKMRQVHLLESPEVSQSESKFPVNGNNCVEKIRFEVYDNEQNLPGEEHPDCLGAVYINNRQYFADVPVLVWELNIGEYQPAQKWLNYRKGKKLSNVDVSNYQKIIAVLAETNRFIKEINKTEI